MSQAVKCILFLYADDSCLVCQHKSINKTENQLNEDFCNICDWFFLSKTSLIVPIKLNYEILNIKIG